MANNDYFEITYRILTHMYECFKTGEKPDINVFGADALKIDNRYWANIMESLFKEGCIKGIGIVNCAGEKGVKMLDPKITQKGIEYLQEWYDNGSEEGKQEKEKTDRKTFAIKMDPEDEETIRKIVNLLQRKEISVGRAFRILEDARSMLLLLAKLPPV